MTKLQSLQSIVELNEFLNFIDANHAYTPDFNKSIDNVINRWTNSMPNIHSDPPCTWDDVITNRCIYLEYIEDKYYTSENSEVTMEASIQHNNYSMLDTTGGGECMVEKRRMLKKIENVSICSQCDLG